MESAKVYLLNRSPIASSGATKAPATPPKQNCSIRSARRSEDRLRVVREMGRRPWQCLAARRLLTTWGSWWILRPIQI